MIGYCFTGFSRDSLARPGDLLGPKAAYMLVAGSTYEGRVDAAAVLRPAAVVTSDNRKHYRVDPTTLRPLFSQYEIHRGKDGRSKEVKTSKAHLSGYPVSGFWDKYLAHALTEYRDWYPVTDASYLLDQMRGVYLEENDDVLAWEAEPYYHTHKKRAYQRGDMSGVPSSLYYGTGAEQTMYRMRLPEDVTIRGISAHAVTATGKKARYHVPVLKGMVPQVSPGQHVRTGAPLFKLGENCVDSPAEAALIRRLEKYMRVKRGHKTYARADIVRWAQPRCLKCFNEMDGEFCTDCNIRGNPVRTALLIRDFKVVAGKFQILYTGADKLDILPDLKGLEEVQRHARKHIFTERAAAADICVDALA